jgi:hypothetical protein
MRQTKRQRKRKSDYEDQDEDESRAGFDDFLQRLIDGERAICVEG